MSEHEHALLGSILLDPAEIDVVAADVSAGDFSDRDLGQLFEALVTIHECGLPSGDMTIVVPELRRMGFPEAVRNAAFLARLVANVTAGHARFYAGEVRRASRLRHQAALGQALVDLTAKQGADPDQIASWLDASITSVGLPAAQSRSVGDIAEDYLRELQEPQFRERIVMSGIANLDGKIGGWMPGELVILAARTGIGKTALGMQIASHLGHEQRPVLFVSLEMKDRELVGRLLCGAAGMNGRRIRSGRYDEYDIAQLQRSADQFRGEPVYIWAPPRATTGKIRAVAKRMSASRGLDLLVVDYLGLVQPTDSKRQRYEQLGQVTGDLKAMAKELNVPVLALCQLNRDADGQEPRLSQLRDSGSIEQDADIVLFIHADKPDTSERTLIVAKHRHGDVGKLSLVWNKARLRFDGQPNDFEGYQQ
jgi:replicative DNA helicase